MPTTPAKTEPELLVIGYGNTLRQDDRAGPLVAGIIEGYALPGVRTVVCAQLSPEHAEAVAAARAVVFVDAQAGPVTQTTQQRVQPGESSQITTHAAEPRTLLALARDVYGRVPPGWMVTVPAERLGFGTDLSAVTRRGIEVAVNKVVKLARVKPAAGGRISVETLAGTGKGTGASLP